MTVTAQDLVDHLGASLPLDVAQQLVDAAQVAVDVVVDEALVVDPAPGVDLAVLYVASDLYRAGQGPAGYSFDVSAAPAITSRLVVRYESLLGDVIDTGSSLG